MNTRTRSGIVAGALSILLLLFVSATAQGASSTLPDAVTETLSFGRFGEVPLYGSARAAHVVLFVSGDGGWDLGVVDMAKALSGLDALVLGIDITRYLGAAGKGTEACTSTAADFEALSQYAQKQMGRTIYTPPVLVGYSSGATLVYATLVQAPTGTFRGAMSLGFCPELRLSRPLCKGEGIEFTSLSQGKGYRFSPAPALAMPWIAFQGDKDQVCDPAVIRTFAGQVGNGSVIMLPGVGHGFSVQKNWLPQFQDSFRKLTAEPDVPRAEALPADIAGLPIVEVPSRGARTDLLAVIATGDGGWAGLDREVADTLAGAGVSVAGLNSLQYLWKRRTPEEAGEALTAILRHYSVVWKRDRFLLVGYSSGADILPFMASRLPEDLKSRVAGVALVGPSPQADFEFHVTDWLGAGPRSTALPVAPEVEKLSGLKVMCFQGEQEKDSLCPLLGSRVIDVVLPGGHHFKGDYASIAKRLLAGIQAPMPVEVP